MSSRTASLFPATTIDAKRARRQVAAIDKQIEQLYYRHAAGKQINILDISKVYKAGHAAVAAGQPLDAAIIAAIATYCQNA